MTSRKVSQKIKAGLLPLTLSICLILSLFCLAAIMFAYYSNILWVGAKTKSRVETNVDSALQYALCSRLKDLSLGSQYTFDLFDDGRDSVRLSLKSWGIFDWLSIEAFDGCFKSSRNVIVGYSQMGKDIIGLYVSNSSPNAITMIGDARIYGNAWIPQGGIKAGYYDRKIYTGKQLIDGEISQSQTDFPQFGNSIEIKVGEIIRLLDLKTQKENQKIPDKHVNPFSEQCVTYFLENSVIIDTEMTGHIIVVSASDITVDSSANLDDIILVAPVIKFSSGFKGCLQAFATDKILLEPGVNLNYPSSLIINSNKGGKVEISENCVVNGLIFLSGKNDQEGLIRIAKSSLINGQVISMGRCEHQGTINGQLFCKSLVISDSSGEHINYLKDGIINGYGIPTLYLFFGIFDRERLNPEILINL